MVARMENQQQMDTLTMAAGEIVGTGEDMAMMSQATWTDAGN